MLLLRLRTPTAAAAASTASTAATVVTARAVWGVATERAAITACAATSREPPRDGRRVGPGRYCMPCHPRHFEPGCVDDMTSYDLASSMCQTLPPRGRSCHPPRLQRRRRCLSPAVPASRCVTMSPSAPPRLPRQPLGSSKYMITTSRCVCVCVCVRRQTRQISYQANHLDCRAVNFKFSVYKMPGKSYCNW